VIELESLKNIGPKSSQRLKKANIFSLTDLLFYFPYRYLDFSHISAISDLIEDSAATISGQVLTFQNIFTRFRKNIQKATIADKTGKIDIIWFNQPYLSKTIIPGKTIKLAGTVSSFQNHLCLISPITSEHKTGKILPLYSETNGLSSSWFQKTIFLNFDSLIATVTTDPISSSILKKYSLPN
jgi:ATP-dependent DNA helicase RecG